MLLFRAGTGGPRRSSRHNEFTATIAQCETIETVAEKLPTTRAELAAHGITGIEFAAFRTNHPSGLGADLVGVRSPDSATRPGSLYRVDGEALYGHKWIYDEAELRHVLSEAGFDGAKAQVRSFREGARQDVAALDTSMRTDETIYVEATKAQ